MKLFLLSLILLTRLVTNAAPPTATTLKQLTFDQKLGATVPLDMTYRDDQNEAVTLHECLQGKPAILVLGYYECPMLCNLVLNGVVESLQEIKPSANAGEQLIFLSIDSRETPELASRKKQTYLKRFGRSYAVEHWHFLCGGEREIGALANAIGFHYAFDQEHRQFAHPTGIVVLTPDGRISRYFFGVTYPAAELRQALVDASLKRTGSPVQALAILCSRFLPLTGKYSSLVMSAVRVLAIGVIALLVFVAFFNHRPVCRPDERSGSP
jgi:protein SCO1/2